MTLTTLKSTLRKLRLSKRWTACKRNSNTLKRHLGGESRSGAFVNIDGLSPEGHWFYVSKDNQYVVDLVIHNLKSVYTRVKGCEISKGIFRKECYFNKLNVEG